MSEIKKNIIIVGATSGIGKCVAEIYLKRGHNVGLAGRNFSVLKEICKQYSNAHYAVLDVRDCQSTIESIDALFNCMGRVDLFLLSSGVGWMNADFNWEHDLCTIETNVLGWTSLINHAYKKIEEQGEGHLAAISSIASLRGLAPAPSYSASKAYQSHFLEALRQRAMASKFPITVTDIRPGFVDTPLLTSTRKFFWIVSVDKAARQLVCALEKRKSVATITKRWLALSYIIKVIPNSIIARVISKC